MQVKKINTNAAYDNSQHNELQYVTLRTPDDHFNDLKDWPHAPNYLSDLEGFEGFEGLRLHYIDIGKASAERTILCLHGQKAWAYSYRKAFQYLIDNNYRIIAPDLFGFGRSDKPTNDEIYSFDFHRQTILALIARLDLKDLRVAGFDWGGWLGMTLPMDAPTTISGLLLANARLHTPDQKIWAGFHVWRALHNAQTDPEIGHAIVRQNASLSTETLKAYDAPFPSFAYKAGVRKFPNLVPLSEDHETTAISMRAAKFLGSEWQGRCALVANSDPVLGIEPMRNLRDRIKGADPIIKVAGSDSLIFEYADQFMPQALDILF